MIHRDESTREYFVFGFPLSDQAWHRFAVRSVLPDDLEGSLEEPSFEIRKLAQRINEEPGRTAAGGPPLHAESLLALRTINQALRWLAGQYLLNDNPGSLARGRQWTGSRLGTDSLSRLFQVFVELFPPVAVQLARLSPREFLADVSGVISGEDHAALEMLLLFLTTTNPAARDTSELYDDDELRRRASFIPFITTLEDYLDNFEPAGSLGTSLFHMLRAPMLASPDSLTGQIEFIRANYAHLLPDHLMRRLLLALDVLKEIDVRRSGEPGPPPVLEFGPGSAAWGADEPEPEAFSTDADWMSNVVLMAKSVYVWLDQQSRWYGRPIRTLGEVPDQELDRLARWGVTGLWLIGLWERSEASRKIKQYMGNPDAAASAYALRDYHIAADLGGEDAYRNLRDRAESRGIRLASDMVPNHMGIDSRWVIEHPGWFLQAEHPPFPAYDFTGGDLCDHPDVTVRIEDGYWDHRDASVVFQRRDERSGDVTYIYHGNDGTSMPWNDTAQLNFLLPEVREAVVGVILDVARRFPIIRFDAAMTLAKKHYQRLWFPAPGDAGAIPSRAEHSLTKTEFDQLFPVEFWREVVDRIASEAPDTLLLAEAFWLMEGYFVRTLGMHRVYNSAFMNMLKMEDNTKYRQTIKNVLEFSPEVLKRFVNFMNNPDERTAVEQFGRGDKYFGCALLLVTMPGLPMLGHGQIEGFSEKYGMEYRRACWDEQVDQDMVRRHEREIFPLMRRRHLFSGAHNFALYDFESDSGWVDENVFAYSNRHGDQRGLIIYNNSYHATSGRIRVASAINRGSAEHPQLTRPSLGEALDIASEAETWWIFRDHGDGQEYLRSATELAEQGFHTHLNGYQSRALVDFQSVTDADGRWAELAADLAGGGAADLKLALRRRELAAELETIRTWLDPAILGWLETAASPVVATADEVESDGQEPVEAPVESPVEPAALAALPESLARTAKELYELSDRPVPATLGARSRQELQEILETAPGSRVLQAVYLAQVLKWIPESDLAVSPDDLPLILEDLRGAVMDWAGHEFIAESLARTAELLAGSESRIVALSGGLTAWCAADLTRPEFAPLLGINEHEGVLWIGGESLESWLLALVVAALIEGKNVPVTSLLDGRSMILQAAAQAGYRVDEMGRILAGEVR